jgi:hypothetical protein
VKNTTIDDYCSKLQEIYNSNSFMLEQNDDFGFFLICYMYKLDLHMNSIRKLSPSPDVQLIARSMIETLIQMLWVAHSPVQRASKWRQYIFVEDWMKLQNLLRQGKDISLEEQHSINSEYEAIKDKFLKHASDKTHKNWKCGAKIHDMASTVEADELYSILYSNLSDWVHGGPNSFSHMVTFTAEMTLNIRNDAPNNILNSCFSIAFQCMYQALAICSQHFSLELEKSLQSIYEQYINDMSQEK